MTTATRADSLPSPAGMEPGISSLRPGTGGAGRGMVAGLCLLGLVVAVLVAGGFALGVQLGNVHNGLLGASFTAVGVFVALRRPDNRMARLFMAFGSASAIMFFGRQYGAHAAAHPGSHLPAAVWVAWLGVWPLALVIVLSTVTIVSFPDGRLPSQRWRPVVAALVVAGAGLALVSALWPVEYGADSLSVAPPFRLAGYATAFRWWNPIRANVYLLDQLAFVVGVVVRFRRARGEEVEQLKWLVYAVTIGIAVMLFDWFVLGSPRLGLLLLPAIPVAAGAAILRYRLYDIDLVINKTLVVGGLAGLITGVYVAVVVGIGSLLGLNGRPNLGLSLVATAVVAVAFAPARQRVQQLANRLVFGHRVTPYEALARLSAQLSGQSQRSELLAGVVASLAEGVGAGEATLWVGSEAALVPVASWPPPANTAPAVAPSDMASLQYRDRTHVRPVCHQGELRGAITLTKPAGEQLSATEDRLLSDLVAQAGLVIENVGLTSELEARLNQISAQADELRAAAKRIVAAQDEARRRIERDLHDGAQQQLVTLALHLQALSDKAVVAGAGDLGPDIDHARRQLSQALVELREMARGIHPSILTDEGLEAALGFLAERSPVAVQLNMDLPRRLPPEVEATAYFVVCEALTNAAKHAEASSVTVSASIDGRRLHIKVVDHGRGGADGHWGSGLQGLTDRLATLDGHLKVSSAAGAGTRLHADIPCG